MIDTTGYRKMELKELQSLVLQTMMDIHQFCEKNKIDYYIIAGTVLGAIRHNGFVPWDDDIDIAMTRDNYDKFKSLFGKDKIMNCYFLQDYLTDKDFGLALMRVCIPNTLLDWPAQNHLRNCKNAYIDIFPLDVVPTNARQQARQANMIKQLNLLCNLKLYRVSNKSNIVNYTLKTVMHGLLFFVPIKWLVKLKLRIMRKYENENSPYLCSMQSHYSYSKQKMLKTIYGKPTLIPFEDTFFYGPEKTDEYLSQLYGDYMRLPPVEKRPKPLDTYIKEK